MALVQNLVPASKYDVKCPYSMTPVGICVHNTANDAPAKNEVSYMISNNNEVSFHIAIDDVEAIQAIPFNRNAWAAGDGGSGNGNRKYIHVEICYSKSGGNKFTKAEQRAAKEIAALLKQFGWNISNVKKHQDFSGKYCPHRTLDMGWQRFLNMISAELEGKGSSSSSELYRVRKSWADAASQIGAYANLDNAKALCDKNPGYNVYNSAGVQVYPVAVKETLQKSYAETGKATVVASKVDVKNSPNASSATVATYYKGEYFNYDQVYITNLYVYCSYISNSGVRRYVAVKDKQTGIRLANCV